MTVWHTRWLTLATNSALIMAMSRGLSLATKAIGALSLIPGA